MKKNKTRSVSYNKWGYIFLLPFFVVYTIFQLIPLVTTIYNSLFENYEDGLLQIGPNWVGIQNYITIFTNGDMIMYTRNTLHMWIWGFVPQILVALLLGAWFADNRLRIKCAGFFKTVIYMPNLIMASAFAMLFFTLFSNNGPVNQIMISMAKSASINIHKPLFTSFASFEPFFVTALMLILWFAANSSNIKNLGFVKTVTRIGNIIALVIIALLAVRVFTAGGLITRFMLSVSGVTEPFEFMNHIWSTRMLVEFMNFTMWFGNTTILLMAGMMGIDTSLYEAAEVDGATSTQRFFRITLPLLKPILIYVMITSLIGGLQMFDVPQILTGSTGDPVRSTMTLIMYLNKHLYSKNFGLGGAVSVVMFIITGILSLIVFKMSGYDKED